MIFRLAAVAALSILVSGCASPSSTITSTRPVDRSFTVYNFSTKSGDTQLTVAAYVENAGGKVLLCAAAGAEGNPDFDWQWPKAMLNRLRVYVGDDKIVDRSPFGAEHIGKDSIVGEAANCVVTDKPWKGGYTGRKPTMKLGAITLRT